MSKQTLIDWIYDLPTQTLTDELKDDIVEMFEMYAKVCEWEDLNVVSVATKSHLLKVWYQTYIVIAVDGIYITAEIGIAETTQKRNG